MYNNNSTLHFLILLQNVIVPQNVTNLVIVYFYTFIFFILLYFYSIFFNSLHKVTKKCTILLSTHKHERPP